MDTFMDKLAQKLTAQEMIKANAAADAAELSRLREKTAEYEALLAEMKKSSEQNAASADKMELGAAKVEENATKAQELLAAGIEKINEIQKKEQDSEELKALLQNLEQAQAELKKSQLEQFEQLTDHVHKENVKVYRNVQAVVVDEASKQNETNGKVLSSLSGKLGAVLGISIVALLTAVAGVVFQILVYLHII